ncbi:MAG: TetR/AcrR family transcriptional regulator [Clostridia bacterium]|nr:TetR/AcrR family transcriptional regulator [Clostridia bacterium]
MISTEEKSLHYRSEQAKSKVLHAAAKLFLEKGYTETTLRELSATSGVNYGSLTFVFRSKEKILSELVGFVLDGQFDFTEKLLTGKTDDKILFYATETTLQLYMAESSEHIRELYSLAYSQQASSDIIYQKITLKLSEIFKERYPDFTQGEFYEKELASAGIMRNYMTRPCGIYFTMDRKVKAFLENTFLLYEIPREKIEEAIQFVSQFDFETLAQQVIDNMLSYLESKT